MGFCLIKLECEKGRRGEKEGAVIRTEYCFVFTFLFDWFGNGERRRRKRKTMTSYSLFSRHCLFEMVVWESGNFAPLSWLKEKKGVIKNNIKKKLCPELIATENWLCRLPRNEIVVDRGSSELKYYKNGRGAESAGYMWGRKKKR